MTITVYLGANEGNDPALKQQCGICFADDLAQIKEILKG